HRKALLRTLAIDRSLDLKECIDPTHRLDRDRREGDFLFAGSLATCVLFNIGHSEERTTCMCPARGFPDRSRFAPSQIELVITIVGVGLQDAGVTRQMRLRMLALAVARVIEYRRRRAGATKRPVVPDVDPASPGVGLSLGQH